MATRTALDEAAGLTGAHTGYTSTRLHDPPSSCHGSSAGDAEDDDRGQLNLVSLPNVVLVHLFKMLPVPDRGRLARTCSRLSAIMQCASVWTDVSIRLSEMEYIANIITVNYSALTGMDRGMVRKYGHFFQRLDVIIDCMRLTLKDFDLLIGLAEKGVIANLILYAKPDVDISRIVDPSLGIIYIPYLKEFPRVAKFIDRMDSNTNIVLQLNDCCRETLKKLYTTAKSEKFCGLLRKLVLPETCMPEKRLAKVFSQRFSAPTAMLISQFPSLQELQLSIINLSEDLLLELADSSRRRTPLRRLVLRYRDVVMRIPRDTFPQLSSSAWGTLASACPSLAVECCVKVDGMPPLTNVIKSDTPLVRLVVSYDENTDANTDCVLKLFEVCKEHSSTLYHFDLSAGTLRSQARIQEGLRSMRRACPKLQHV